MNAMSRERQNSQKLGAKDADWQNPGDKSNETVKFMIARAKKRSLGNSAMVITIYYHDWKPDPRQISAEGNDPICWCKLT